MQSLGTISKMTEWSQFISKANHADHSNPRLCPSHECQRSWSWTVPWRPTRSSVANTKKRCPLHHRGLECKRTKSRDTWSNKFGLGIQNEAGQKLTEFCRVPKNGSFWTVVLEKTLESSLDCKEIHPVHPKGDQSWVFIGKTDVEWCWSWNSNTLATWC